jgi:CRISPR/Cas system-associated exonuclease Cas4 (RecB family)
MALCYHFIERKKVWYILNPKYCGGWEMAGDKFLAVWVSHSSIGDYLKCPRAYFLNNVYKDPATGHKVKIMSPALALGQIVHEVVESLSVLPTAERFKEPLFAKYEQRWKKVNGIKGGFESEEQEAQFFERGRLMLKRILDNPGPLLNLAVKIKMDLPYYWLSEEENIILCGKIDWLEYLKEENAVHIIDFKTGKGEEAADSLQLPIYYLLASHCQPRKVVKASYWYIEREDHLTSKELPDALEAEAKILTIAKEIRLARKLSRYKCPHGEAGCRACKPLEAVIKGEATFVGVNEYNQDIYVSTQPKAEALDMSEIL